MNNSIIKNFETCPNCLLSFYKTRPGKHKGATLYRLECLLKSCKGFVSRADREAPIVKCCRCGDTGISEVMNEGKIITTRCRCGGSYETD